MDLMAKGNVVYEPMYNKSWHCPMRAVHIRFVIRLSEIHHKTFVIADHRVIIMSHHVSFIA